MPYRSLIGTLAVAASLLVPNTASASDPRWFRVMDGAARREAREFEWKVSVLATEPYVFETGFCDDQRLHGRTSVSKLRLIVTGPADTRLVGTVQGRDPLAGSFGSQGSHSFESGRLAITLQLPAEAEPCFDLALCDRDGAQVLARSVCLALDQELSERVTLPVLVVPVATPEVASPSESGCSFAPSARRSGATWAAAAAVAIALGRRRRNEPR